MRILRTDMLPFILLVLFMTGCVSGPILPDNMAKADQETYPENYKELVKQYFNDRLKEPYSAKFRYIEIPQRTYQRFPSVQNDNNQNLGYLVFVDVNAKNSYGGYTGWEEFRFLIRDGRIVHRFTKNSHQIETWYK